MCEQDIRVAFVNLGCAKNLVDSEVMAGSLRDAGYRITGDRLDADVIIVNTCGFISEAREEAIAEIFASLDILVTDDGVPVIAAGCLSQRHPDELQEGIPELAGIIGVNDLECVVEAVDHAVSKQFYRRVTPESRGVPGGLGRYRWTPDHYSYLKIAEGCDRRCHYCAIPGIRGSYRSRSLEEILEEATQLVASGARELNLVAQDVTLYRDPGSPAGLEELLLRLSSEFPDTWIRILYAHPEGVDWSLVDVLRSRDNLCGYLDIPLQHASADILRAMGRPEDPRRVRDFLTQLRRRFPDVAVRSTFMVGFPGETDEHFEELVHLVSELQLDDSAVFVFSPEEGTPAADLEDAVSPSVASERANRLRTVVEEASFGAKQRFVGETLEAVVDVRTDDGWLARHRGQAPDVDGAIFIDDPLPGEVRVGERLSIHIDGADSTDLWGHVVDGA